MWLKFDKRDLVVLGNGSSRDSGLQYAMDNSLAVVTINGLDTEASVLFCMATQQKYLDAIQKINSNAVPVIVPASLNSNQGVIRLPVAEFDYLEGIATSNSKQREFRQDFVLLTILSLLDEIYPEIQTDENALRVHLFGFDFFIDESKNKNYSENEFLASMLLRQKSLFDMLVTNPNSFHNLTLLNNSGIRNETKLRFTSIDKSAPMISERDLQAAIDKNNALLKDCFDRAQDGQLQIIAELTNNHLGDTSRLREMVELCKSQGAHIIKIQKRDIGTLYTAEERLSSYASPFGTTLEAYRKGVELTREQIEFLTVLCAELEIPWFSSVLDMPSLEFLLPFRPLSIKAPSTISDHRNFLIQLSSSTIEWLFISTGGTSEVFLDWINRTFSEKRLVVMQCTSSYPTAAEDCNVRVIESIKNLRSDDSILPGYSSHDIGSTASQLAYSLGAVFIEKHVKLGSVDWIHFDGVALDLSTNSLRQFADDLFEARKILGNSQKQILESEHHKYKPNSVHN